jgi:transcriptional regulator with XRE-family HTH domain
MTQVTERAPEFDLADRMRKSLRHAGIGVQDMADYLEVSRNAVGTWINGRNKPSPQTVRLWALRCGVPYGWLRDGGTGVTRPGPDGDAGWAPRGSNPQPADYKVDGCEPPVTHGSDDPIPFFPRRRHLQPVRDQAKAAA